MHSVFGLAFKEALWAKRAELRTHLCLWGTSTEPAAFLLLIRLLRRVRVQFLLSKVRKPFGPFGKLRASFDAPFGGEAGRSSIPSSRTFGQLARQVPSSLTDLGVCRLSVRGDRDACPLYFLSLPYYLSNCHGLSHRFGHHYLLLQREFALRRLKTPLFLSF